MTGAPQRDNERRALLAALTLLLDNLSEVVHVAITGADGRKIADLLWPPPLRQAPETPPEPARADDDRDCRADILAVLREAGRRLTTNQILAELERRSWLWGEGTVKRHLAGLMSDGELTNDSRARPPGYAQAT